MSQKSNRVQELMGKVEPGYDPPPADLASSLLEFGLLCVLARRLSKTQCAATLKQLQGGFVDWNELRISQIQHIRPAIATKADAVALDVARDIKTYLQEVFQTNHGFDLEFLRDDAAAGAKFISELFFLGGAAGHDLLWAASGGQLPATPAIVRVLDRLGLANRTGSIRRAREVIGPIVPKGKDREFVSRFGRVAVDWCDSRKPLCHECPLLDSCPHGAKVYKEWQAQQERLEAQRKREEARAEAERKKDDARRKREEERERKRREADERKRARDKARVDREKKRKEEEAAKKRAKVDAARKKVAESKKAAEAKKKAAAKEKAAAAKKKAAKKPAAKKTTKKTAAKKTTAKKTPTKKSATKKTPTKKPAAKKTSTKKPAAKKTPTKKPATKKTVTKKSSTKKTATKKPSTKKTTKKTTTTKKSTTKKSTSKKKASKKTATKKR